MGGKPVCLTNSKYWLFVSKPARNVVINCLKPKMATLFAVTVTTKNTTVKTKGARFVRAFYFLPQGIAVIIWNMY